MFERFTDGSRRVLALAQEEAQMVPTGFIGCEHLLLALVRLKDGIAAKVIDACGITYPATRELVTRLVKVMEASIDSPGFTRDAKRALELALRSAQQLGHDYIGTEHLLLGLLRDQNGIAASVLKAMGIRSDRIREVVYSSLGVEPAAEGILGLKQAERNLFAQRNSIRYPVRVVAGPIDPIAIGGLEGRIVGLLLFEDEFDVIWSVNGSHDDLWSLLGRLEDDDHPSAGTTPRWVRIVDDAGSAYESESKTFVREETCWSGHITCWPSPPPGANLLRLTWLDRSIEIQL